MRAYLAGAVMLAVAMSVGRFAYTPLLVVMRGDARLDIATAGLLASVNLAGYLAGALVALLPALKHRRATIVTASAYAIAALTATMAGPQWTWTAARFLTGVMSGIVFVLTLSTLLERAAATRSRRGPAVLFSGIGLGIAVVGLLVPAFVHLGGSRVAWLALGVVSGAAVAIVSSWFPRDERTAAALDPVERRRDPRAFWWLALVYTVEGGVYIIPATFLVAMVAETPALASPRAVYLGARRRRGGALRRTVVGGRSARRRRERAGDGRRRAGRDPGRAGGRARRSRRADPSDRPRRNLPRHDGPRDVARPRILGQTG